MRILHAHDFFAPGNSRFGFDMDRLLVERGHEVHVLSAVGPLGPADGAVVDGVTFHTFPRREGTLPARLAGARVDYRRLDGLGRFDVLVLNQPVCGDAVLRCAAARDVPRVYWFISPWAAEWRAENPDAGRLRAWIHAGLRNRMEDQVLAACDAVLVESDYIRGELLRRHPRVPPDRITLATGSVDLRRFRPDGTRAQARARWGLGDGPLALTVRRHVERMGIDLLLRAAARMPELQVVVGGDGPRRAELEALATSLGVRARFVGYVPDEDLPSLYRAADVFVLPTRELEGFGLVAVEAMACGTPALGTPVGAIPEILGPLGMVVESPTAEALAEGLRRFFAAADPELGERCRAYVAERFDWSRAIGTVEQVLLESARHGRR